jgi:oligopeptidase B
VDTTGYETYDIYFKDLQTGEMLPDVIKGVAGGLVWGADNSVVREQDCACGEE